MNPQITSIMTPVDLKLRTKKFAVRVIRMTETLPRNRVADVVGRQVLRSGTSVGANYRAACRAKSRADFVSKMGTVEEECDESLFWMEILVDNNLVKESRLRSLRQEGTEILSIIVTSAKTARTSKSS